MVIVGFLQGISGYGLISKFHETNSMVQNHTSVFDMQRVLHFLARAFDHCPAKEHNRCLNVWCGCPWPAARHDCSDVRCNIDYLYCLRMLVGANRNK